MSEKPNRARHQSATGLHQAVPKMREKRHLLLKTGISKRTVYTVFTVLVLFAVLLIASLAMSASDRKKHTDYYAQAETCYASGDYDKAISLLRKAVGMRDCEKCTWLMADCYEKQGNIDKALELMRTMDTTETEVQQRVAELEYEKTRQGKAGTITVAGQNVSLDSAALVLEGQGLGDDTLGEVARLYALTSLDLSDNEFRDISALGKLGGLVELDLGNNSIEDISALSTLVSLRNLCLDNNPLKDLSPLLKLTNLSSLSIRGIGISESQLQALSKALPGCAIHSDASSSDKMEISLGGVTFMSDVTELDLSGREISDISALSSCRQLTKLDLSGNNIHDLTPLMNIPGLKELNISDNAVTDLRPLMGVLSLERIDAEKNEISSTVPLGSLSALLELNLDNNPISDFSGLSKLTALEKLSLEGTGLKDGDLDWLSGLSSLLELNINNNPELGGEAVDKLRLSIRDCRIAHSELVYSVQIAGESFKENITELDLSNRALEDISALGGFSNLETLNLRGNNIRNIYILQGNSSIKNLDLACNNIQDVTALAYMPSLEYLDVSGNLIQSVSPFINLANLKRIDLSGNKLTEEQIEVLQNALPNCEIINE